MANQQVKIKGQLAQDDGYEFQLGKVDESERRTWWDIPMPPCPDCGQVLSGDEAAHATSPIECRNCGSVFSTQTRDDKIWLRRHRLA